MKEEEAWPVTGKAFNSDLKVAKEERLQREREQSSVCVCTLPIMH